MKRNSTTLFFESPGATTLIPWVNDAPDFNGFSEPTLSVLQSSWQNFLDGGQELEIIPDPEPIPESNYNPSQFLQDMFASASFESWLSNFSTFKQSGFINAATNAKIDNDWSVVQSFYNELKTAFNPTTEQISEWQAIVNNNSIPINF